MGNSNGTQDNGNGAWDNDDEMQEMMAMMATKETIETIAMTECATAEREK